METDLMALFPSVEKNPEIELAVNRARKMADHNLILLVGHESLEVAIAAAEKLSLQLSTDPSIRSVKGRLNDDEELEWYRFYSHYSGQLLTPQLRELLFNHGGYFWQQQVMAQVYSPFTAVSAEELQRDPMLLTRNFLVSLGRQYNRLQPQDGWMTTTDDQGKHFILLAATVAINPYSLVESEALAQRIEVALAGVKEFAPKLECLRQGTLFYAAHGISQAKSEISTIGFGSILGICLLLLVIFRSLRPFYLAGLSVLAGLLFASSMTVAVFGEIHIFTIVIGASLIGVSIDYSFHYLCEWISDGGLWQPVAALRKIMPAITLGFLTSALAYLVLLVTPFPGLRQLAVFSGAGLFAAYATVVTFFPLLLQCKASKTFSPFNQTSAWVRTFRESKARLAVPLLLVAACLVTIPHLKVDDDVRQLQAVPRDLQQQGKKITALTGQDFGHQFLLVRGETKEVVLQRLSVVSRLLDGEVRKGTLIGYRSLSSVLPTVAQQQEDYALAQKELFRPWLPQLVKQLGLTQEVMQNRQHDSFRPLTMEAWLNSSVSEGWRTLWLGRIKSKDAAVIVLRGVHKPRAVKILASEHAGVDYVSRPDELSKLFRYYRIKVSLLLGISYIGIFLLLCLRYGVFKSCRVLLAPILAGAAALAVLAMAGIPLNLFGVLGLVLVLGIGIDYTLFMAECRRNPVSTLLAITLSACTTLLSFGLLCLSETVAIKTFGLVVLVGIFVAFVLSPLAYDTSYAVKRE